MADVLPDLDVGLRPYAGLWIAVVDGRIVGVGDSARVARLAAKRSRPKDEPVVLRVSDEGRGVEWPGSYDRMTK